MLYKIKEKERLQTAKYLEIQSLKNNVMFLRNLPIHILFLRSLFWQKPIQMHCRCLHILLWTNSWFRITVNQKIIFFNKSWQFQILHWVRSYNGCVLDISIEFNYRYTLRVHSTIATRCAFVWVVFGCMYLCRWQFVAEIFWISLCVFSVHHVCVWG